MNTKLQKYTAAMMAAILSLSYTGGMQTLAADKTQNIVIIGDSLSAGTALADNQNSYVELVDDCARVNVQNFSAEGRTTQDVLDSLDDAQVRAALTQADVIVVNVGIHDIMDPFMAKAHEYMDKWGFKKFSDVFFANLTDYNLNEMDLMIYNAELVNAAETNKESAAANMLEIGEKLSSYADAQVVIQNVYNPIDTIENLSDLSDKRQTAYTSICDVVSKALNTSVNQSITETAQANGYEVIDVFGGFKGFAYKYVNLSDLDMNATAEGHRWVADQVIDKLGLIPRGDVNNDGAIDATDAAAVLIHSASIGSGGSGTIGEASQTAADVNEDNAVDSVDAARILVYAAALGADGDPSWE